MSTHRLYEPIKINVKKKWQLPTGHKQDRANTTFDNRPKRIRTRQAEKRFIMRDYE